MPLGDSLTAGGYNLNCVWHQEGGFNTGCEWFEEGGYREHLWRRLKNENYNFDFVGSLTHGQMFFPDAEHEGHSGWKIHEVDSITEAALTKFDPDVVLLIVGSNDLIKAYEIESAPLRLRELVKKILAHRPDIELFVGSPITTNNLILNSRIQIYNWTIEKEISQLRDQYPNLHWVDMYRESKIGQGKDDLTDGVHPTVLGYQKMAGVWFHALVEANVFAKNSPSSHVMSGKKQ